MRAVLSVSGPSLSSDCREVVSAMRRLGIHGDVSSNVTVIDGDVEPGCRATIVTKPVKQSSKKLWQTLLADMAFTCAHVEIISHEDGCVFDVFRKSACPGANDAS